MDRATPAQVKQWIREYNRSARQRRQNGCPPQQNRGMYCMLLDLHQQPTITNQIIPADPATRTTLNSNQHIRLLAIPCTLAGLLWALTCECHERNSVPSTVPRKLQWLSRWQFGWGPAPLSRRIAVWWTWASTTAAAGLRSSRRAASDGLRRS